MPRPSGKGRSKEVVEMVVVEAVAVHMALDQVMAQEVALETVTTIVVAEAVEEEAVMVEKGQVTVALAWNMDPEVDIDIAVLAKEEVVEVEARAKETVLGSGCGSDNGLYWLCERWKRRRRRQWWRWWKRRFELW
ncbi:hypothetical protein CDL15_Pgr000645 [Punica granatum]|uniref:Uncharacterized protein n=1 Tax=Punica granatum TaxID=22663 RepID=A0A218W3R3_PUNGR|nr:hypothetical protein CDL15_Pgr000645 [Punica granatum]